MSKTIEQIIDDVLDGKPAIQNAFKKLDHYATSKCRYKPLLACFARLAVEQNVDLSHPNMERTLATAATKAGLQIKTEKVFTDIIDNKISAERLDIVARFFASRYQECSAEDLQRNCKPTSKKDAPKAEVEAPSLKVTILSVEFKQNARQIVWRCKSKKWIYEFATNHNPTLGTTDKLQRYAIDMSKRKAKIECGQEPPPRGYINFTQKGYALLDIENIGRSFTAALIGKFKIDLARS